MSKTRPPKSNEDRLTDVIGRMKTIAGHDIAYDVHLSLLWQSVGDLVTICKSQEARLHQLERGG